MLAGGVGADTLTGNGGDDRLDGGADNDTLNDNSGANLFIGGAGNDTLNVTSTGIDRIAVARGHGLDTVVGTGTTVNDVLEVSNGIAKSAMALIKTGNDLIVDLGAGRVSRCEIGMRRTQRGDTEDHWRCRVGTWTDRHSHSGRDADHGVTGGRIRHVAHRQSNLDSLAARFVCRRHPRFHQRYAVGTQR